MVDDKFEKSHHYIKFSLILYYKIIEKCIDRILEARKIKRKREREREREREIIVNREKRSKISI